MSVHGEITTYQLNESEHDKIKKQTPLFYIECKEDGLKDKEIAALMDISLNELLALKSRWEFVGADLKEMKRKIKNAKRFSGKFNNVQESQRIKPNRRDGEVPKKQTNKSKKEKAIHLLRTTNMKVVDIAKETGLSAQTLYQHSKKIREEAKKEGTLPASTITYPEKKETLVIDEQKAPKKSYQDKLNELNYEKERMKENWKKEQDKVIKLEDDLDKAYQTIKQLEADVQEGQSPNHTSLKNTIKQLEQLLKDEKDKKTYLVQENDKLKRQVHNEQKLNAYHKNELKLAREREQIIDKQQAKIRKLENLLITYVGESYELDQDIRSASEVG